MRVGSLDRRVEIIRDVESGKNDLGEALKTSTVTSVWASKRTTSGRQYIESGAQGVDEQKAVFVIRYREISSGDRVRSDGREYKIEAVRQLGRRQYLELMATGS